MKKLWIIGGIVVVAAVVLTIVLTTSKTKKAAAPSSSTSTQTSSTAGTAKKACDLFTLADAKQVLGADAKQGTSAPATSSPDLDVSVCIYTTSATGLSAPTASLLARVPKSTFGTNSNKLQFTTSKPATQSVSGYGDAAYWDPQYGQLNVLKHNTWYIISNGPINPALHTLDKAKQLADVLISKL